MTQRWKLVIQWQQPHAHLNLHTTSTAQLMVQAHKQYNHFPDTN